MLTMKGDLSMNQIKIGNFLRELRKEKGLTQEQLAEGCRLYGSTELEIHAYWNSNNVHIMEQHL